jgi:uncharacterized membrane protein YbhN (UPF0104 family)
MIRFAGVVLFVVVLARTDLAELWGYMKQVAASSLLIGIGFQMLLLVVKSWRWYILNEEGYDRRTFLSRSGEFFEGYAIGVITPGRFGELMKAGHAGTKKGILGAGLKVIAERGMDLSIFFVIGGIAIMHQALPGVGPVWGRIVLSIGIAGMLLAFLILWSPAVVRFAEIPLRWIRQLGRNESMGFRHKSLPSTFLFLILSVTGNLCYFTCCYFLATGVGLDITMVETSGGVAAAGIANTIPITVMGLGTREVTFLYVFQAFPQAQVLAFSGLVFLIAQIGAGLVSMILGQWLLFKFKVQSSKS